jgi:hypothetical protein
VPLLAPPRPALAPPWPALAPPPVPPLLEPPLPPPPHPVATAAIKANIARADFIVARRLRRQTQQFINAFDSDHERT